MKLAGAKPKNELRGVKIRTFNYWVIIAACVLYALLLFETVAVMREYDNLTALTEHYRVCQHDAELVHEGSDYLTEQVRLYVVLHDVKYANNYFNEAEVTCRRDNALAELSGQPVSDLARQSLVSALECSNLLMEREIYAMRLIAEATNAELSELPERVRTTELSEEDRALTPERQQQRAMGIVFDSNYQDAKELIYSYVSGFLDGVMSGAQARWAESSDKLSHLLGWQRACISMLFVLTVVTFIVITVLIIKPLTIYVGCIRDDKLFEIMGAYEFKYLALTYNSIYELNAESKEILSHQATTDHLTGLLNRGAFSQLCDVLKEAREPVSLMLCDVDKFKEINDTYGHETGDKVLQKVADCLSSNFRSTDTPARVGGDEFAVLMPKLTAENRSIVADKVEAINRMLADTSDGLPATSLSVGAAFSARGYVDELYTDADKALYKVKQHGRSGYAFYDGEE